MKRLPVIFKRQLSNYLSSPATYFGIVIFLIVNTALGFHIGNFLEKPPANLHAFFQFHPWLYLFFIPFISTLLWSDEHKDNALSFTNTLPISALELTLGKFLAAWSLCALTLSLNFPLVIAINYLAMADNLSILAQFIGSWLLAGAYLSFACLVCVLAYNRLIIFAITLALLLTASTLSSVLDMLEHQAPIWVIDSLISLNPRIRFNAIDNGLLTLHDTSYFISMIIAFLTATTLTLNFRKG
ncbi:ABC-2 type transport system permease protein [Pseudomonas gessardii]|uniref:ABC transporter permease n=1 Tax=Pseudomonas gessardii TaxID=78544 RepID=UPI000889CB11|nr:ABC transporter permease [Pseudomonas gessardii]MRU52396.1 ABC transporter permease [Pseudomonas gessardii]ONH39737.1 ABC transporter permease [Pseudomonas gessardii]SDQ71539.1 ABC-2 type transport system permease protein [Pseudomonas gessardii]